MAKRTFIVSPDYMPAHILEWHRLNTAFQYDLGESIGLLMPAGHAGYHRMVSENKADIIFANPFDAGWLMTEYGYRPLAKPVQSPDEVVIFCHRDSEMQHLQDLQAKMTFASLVNRDVEMIGLRLLEAANLGKQDLQWYAADCFQAVLRMVRDGKAQAGLMLAVVFDALDLPLRSSFRVLVRSAMEDISHLFLVRGDDPELHEKLAKILIQGRRKTRYYSIFREINFRRGFELMSDEDGLFLVDILETLKD